MSDQPRSEPPASQLSGVKPEDFQPGERVRNTRTGEVGIVHAVYPDDWEDNLEVLLSEVPRRYTIWDARRYVESAPEGAT